MRKGIGVSPGVAIGTAYCIHEIYVDPETRRLEESEALAELERYDQQPVEKCHRGIFQPRQVRNKVPHESANNDLRRNFAITSV